MLRKIFVVQNQEDTKELRIDKVSEYAVVLSIGDEAVYLNDEAWRELTSLAYEIYLTPAEDSDDAS